MNVRIRKEIRLILPFLVFQVLVLGCYALWLKNIISSWQHDFQTIDDEFHYFRTRFGKYELVHMWALITSYCILAACSVNLFSSDYTDECITRLLLQPVSRMRLWREKFNLLLACCIVVGIFSVGLLKVGSTGLIDFEKSFYNSKVESS
jgi:ABC-type transport system involved in multi-copper enzyme maturation permease subunit